MYHTYWNLLPAFNNNTLTYLSRQLYLPVSVTQKIRFNIYYPSQTTSKNNHNCWCPLCKELLVWNFYCSESRSCLKLHKKLSLVGFQAQFSSYRNLFSKWCPNSCRCNFYCQTGNALQGIELFIAADFLHCQVQTWTVKAKDNARTHWFLSILIMPLSICKAFKKRKWAHTGSHLENWIILVLPVCF